MEVRMARASVRWFIWIGVSLTTLGILLNFLLEQQTLHLGWAGFNLLQHTFPPMIMLGLLVTLAGSVAWGWRRASVSRLALCGVVVAVLALVAVKLIPINVHGGGWTLWLGFACLIALLIALLFLVFAALRFTGSRLAQRQK
jgi:hypothetical protein